MNVDKNRKISPELNKKIINEMIEESKKKSKKPDNEIFTRFKSLSGFLLFLFFSGIGFAIWISLHTIWKWL